MDYEPNVRIARALPGFQPLSQLWQGGDPLFPSEQSARWAIRIHRAALIEAEAIALYRGATHLKVDVLAEIIRRKAVEDFKRRHA